MNSEKVSVFKSRLEDDLRKFSCSHMILRPYIKYLLYIYHGSVTFEGYDEINWNKPLILVPSHQNAFMDALIIVAFTSYRPERYLYPLIRADIYENSVLKKIVSRYHMIPVFRPRDRKDIKFANKAVFSLCEDLLKLNHNLLIHAEGSCIPQKKVRTFRKGFARVAFNAEEKKHFGLGVQIVPVSINYEHIKQRAGHVFVLFHKSVNVAAYQKEYEKEPQKTINKLTGYVEKKVREHNIHIENPEDSKLAEKCFKIWLNEHNLTTGGEIIRAQNNLANTLNSWTADQKRYLNIQVSRLEQTLRTVNMDFESLDFSPPNTGKIILKGLPLLLLSPVVLWGYIHHILPLLLADKIVNHKVKEEQFLSSARFILWMAFIPLTYVLIGGALAFSGAGMLFIAIYLGSLPIGGIIARFLKRFYSKWLNALRARWAISRNPSAFKTINKRWEKVVGLLKEKVKE